MANGAAAVESVFGPVVVVYTVSDPSVPAIVVAFTDVVEDEIDIA